MIQSKTTNKESKSCLKEMRLGRDELSRKQSLLINRTLYYASRSSCHQRHGAMVVKSGRVISISTNRNNNNPANFCTHLFNEYREYVSIHAEVAALKNVSPKKARGATIYVARVMKNGEPGYSRPCPECAKVLEEMGIKKVIYT